MFRTVPQDSLEHSIITDDPEVFVVGRWATEKDGEFRGMAFANIEEATLARDALNRAHTAACSA